MTHFLRLLAAASLLLAAPAFAGDRATSGAPYFEVFAGGEKVEALPLASTDVEVIVGGVIADVRITQVYENRGTVPVEAVYVFPASSRATVYAATMTVGDRVIRAKLRERGEARREYDEAKAEGRTASLLEQQDVGAFRMNVANVLPGDSIKVEMHYAELLVPTKGVYEFFFPTTAPEAKYGETGATAMPSSPASAVVDHAFGMRVHVLSGAPISRIDSPSHPLDITRPAPGEAIATIRADDARAGARDFVLRYAMLGDDVGTGVLAYRGAEENFFLLTAQPPAVVAPAAVPPREYIFVIDVSGSMTGRPLDVSRGLVADIFSTLRPDDRFNVIFFAGGSTVLSESGSLPATADARAEAMAMLHDVQASGGTELAQALATAYALPATPGMARSIVLATDGAIAAGGDVAKLISGNVDSANVFVFGIGDSLDRSVIDRLARAGQGEPFVVEELADAEAQARLLREYVDRPVLTHVRLSWTGADLYDLEPAKLPDLFAERPIVIVGKYRGELAGEVVVDGISGRAPVRLHVDLARAQQDPGLSSLPLLWARRRVDRVQDEAGCTSSPDYSWSSRSCMGDEEVRAQVLDVGLRYGVLTPFTSFVAVTDEVRTADGAVRVDQPVPARDVEEAPVAAYGFDAGDGFVSTMGNNGDMAQVLGSSGDRGRLIGGAARSLRGMVFTRTPPLPSQLVAGHQMVEDADGWRDLAHRADARMLRIRRDSPAFRALLALRPELAAVFALPGNVLVSLGEWSVLITPDGFSDYPEQTLRDAADAP